MADLVARHAAAFALEVLGTFPAAIVQGARQVGKSTFAGILAKRFDSLSVTLDDHATRSAAEEDPTTFVDQNPNGLLVIDEIQRVPGLILAIKASIDRNRRPAQYLLTGSSDLLRLQDTPDSLAGRAATVRLRGLSQGEIVGRPDDFLNRLRGNIDIPRFRTTFTREQYVAAIARGGYPEVQSISSRLRNIWFDSYAERIVRRDVAEIARRVDPSRVSAVLRLLAANQSGELVRARVARDAGLPESTISAYIDLLETVYLTEKLPPWTPNLTSRESAKPKMCVADSGLALRLSRISEQQLVPVTGGPLLGPAVEGFVVTELLKQQGWSNQEFELFHYRDRDGLEVDLVAEFSDGAVIALEVKSGATFSSVQYKGLRSLRDRLGERFLGGYVLNTGTSGYSFGPKLWGLPVSALWEL